MATTRIPSLDGLRALAISLVLIDHSAHVDVSAPFRTWYWHTYAHIGVLIFFIVSGYLITTLMLRESFINVPQFYIRRVWRIFPVAFSYLAIVTLLHYSHFSLRDIVFSWTFMASVGLSFFENFPWDFGHLWSLSVEEWYYLLWPLLLALGLYNAKLAAWSAIVIAPVFRFTMSKYDQSDAALFLFPSVMDSIATGCLIAFYAKPLTALITKYQRWLGFLWLFAFSTPALIVLANHTHILWPLPQLLGHSAWTLFNASVGLGILWAIIAKPRILNNSLSIWVGTLSYSLYVWHMPLCNPALAIPFPFNLAFAFGIAAISYYLIEQPILQLRADLRKLHTFAPCSHYAS